MARNKTYMPQSTAGLTRYYEQSKVAIKIKPEHVIVACVIIIALEIILKFIG